MKAIPFLILSIVAFSCNFSQKKHPINESTILPTATSIGNNLDKDNLWVFLLAGQSNMAGRGLIVPKDTVSSPRIYSIDSAGQLVFAKEPLHFYEPNLRGLDCGLSFGKRLLDGIPDSISLLILPTAVGGSSIEQWLGDSTHRGVKLLSNFKEKVAFGASLGTIKSILWHQGESNANPEKLATYPEKLASLIQLFRDEAGLDSLPILIGELAAFPKNYENRQAVNGIIHDYATEDAYASVIYTQDLTHKGDSTHFDAESLRKMGGRFAEAYLDLIK